MTRASDYYLNGYLKGRFQGHDALVKTLNDLVNIGPRHGFQWEQKYQNTFDLRPNAHRYDTSVMDVIFSSCIPSLVSDVIGPDLVMMHVQIRRSFVGPSYMDWHRDTYRYGERMVGNFPPVHKVIFYPTLGLRSEPKLKLRVGSHRRNFNSQHDDMQGMNDLPSDTYDSSDDEFLLFDTSMMHGVIPDSDPMGSIRIIYSFIRRSQYEISLATQSIHRDQVELYTHGIESLRG